MPDWETVNQEQNPTAKEGEQPEHTFLFDLVDILRPFPKQHKMETS